MNKRREARGQTTFTMLKANTNAAKGGTLLHAYVKYPQGVAKEVASIKAYKGPAELSGLSLKGEHK